MNMRDLVAAGIGAVVGAATTYFVLDRMHQNDITLLLDEVDAEMRKHFEARELAMANEYPEGVDSTTILPGYLTRDKLSPELQEVLEDAESTDDPPFTISTDGDDGGEGEEGDEDPEEDEPEETQPYDGVYMINPKDVGPLVVIASYNHDDGSLEIDTAMSAKTDLDEIIENDALFSLINEKAFDILMSAGEREEGADRRIIAIRNSVINLDFVIAY